MKANKLAQYTGFLTLATAIILIFSFMGLRITFGYPGIIRKDVGTIMVNLYNYRAVVPYLFYGIGIGGFLIVYMSILTGKVFDAYKENTFAGLGKISGVIYGVLLFTGILRYTRLFPHLAEAYVQHKSNDEILKVVFSSFNEYVGFTVAEHVGYMFLTAMILFFSIAILQIKIAKPSLGIFGIMTSFGLFIGSLEFFGIRQLFMVNRIFSMATCIWLLLLGISLICLKQPADKQNAKTEILLDKLL